MRTSESEHDGTQCPQCRAQAELAHAMGGFAEAIEKALKDGVFERLGRETAMRREKAFCEAFFGRKY